MKISNIFIFLIFLFLIEILRSEPSSKLKVATFNTYWLFHPPHKTVELPWANKNESTKHLKEVAKVIANISADIILLVEVNTLEIVEELREEITLLTGGNLTYTTSFVLGTDTATMQNVAVLSTIQPKFESIRVEDKLPFPLSFSKCNFNKTGTTGVSKHIITSFQFNTTKETFSFILFGLHFIAIPTEPERCSKREAQASILMNKIKYYNFMNPNLGFIALGDFNDYDDEHIDKHDHIPTSKTLSIFKDKTGLNMTNVIGFINKTKRYTHWYDENNNKKIDEGELSVLDHIVVSSNFKKYISNVEVLHHFYPDGNLNISDHWPLVVEFDFAKSEPEEPESPLEIIVPSSIYFVFFIAFVVATAIFVLNKIRNKKKPEPLEQESP